jgi:hypothetical protein
MRKNLGKRNFTSSLELLKEKLRPFLERSPSSSSIARESLSGAKCKDLNG